MKNYLCHPEKNHQKTKILCIALVILGILCFYFAGQTAQIPFARMIGQFLAFAFLLGFIFITSKFLLTEYSYALEDGTLFFSSVTGKKIKNLGSLPLNESVLFFNQKEWKETAKQYPLKQTLSFCQNLSPENPHYLLAKTEAGNILIRFEPDETLKALIREALAATAETKLEK